MPESEPVTILLVNSIAEEIKLVTLNFRSFFPGCRVEAVYTVEEALQWGHRASWQLIVIDEGLLAPRPASVFSELRRLAPYATLVLQTDHSDLPAAVKAVQNGADFLLYKRSPGFLSELVSYTKGALETRAIRMTLKRTQERHDRLIEILGDGLYELDAEGRFVYVSPLAAEMLGYAQDELVGTPYSAVVPSDQQDRARHRFNDRRTGTRATRRIEIDLIRKAPPDKATPTRIRAEISARGLYDFNHRYLGTIGLLHDTSQYRRQTKTIDQLEHQLRESDRLLAIARRLSTLSKNLHAPHNAIYAQSQLLLKTIRDAHLIEQADSLATYAAEAAHLGKELVQTTTDIGIRRDTINHVIDTVLADVSFSHAHYDWIERAYGPDLPPFTGSSDILMNLLRILLSHARRYMAAIGSRHRLRINTSIIGQDEATAGTSSLIPRTTAAEFVIHIQETDMIATVEEPPPQTSGDLFEAYALIKRLGGRWDFLAPVGGFLSIKVWIPAEQAPLQNSFATPIGPVASSAGGVGAHPAEAIHHAPADTLPPTPLLLDRSTEPLPDRRKRVRTNVGLPAGVTIGNALHEGVLTYLSPGGASLEVEGVLPSFEQQPVYLLIKTAVSILELDAIAHDRGQIPRQAGAERRMSRLALEFTALDEGRQRILTSFIEAARVQAFAISVEAQFPPIDRTGDFVAAFTEDDLRGTDHRETLRVRVSLPVRIETTDVAVKGLSGIAVDFSRGGACVQTAPFPKLTDEVLTLHFSSTDVRDQRRIQKPEAPEVILSGRIIYRALDPTVPSELPSGPTQSKQRTGIRFSQLTPASERDVNRVLAQHIGSSIEVAHQDGRPLIMSDRWECRNMYHQAIAVTADHARHQISSDNPIVIVIPGFGSTQTDYIPLSFYLAANHFRVLRYDHSNHVGQSEGNVVHTTLGNMLTDLRSVLAFVHATWPTAPVALLAEDVAARVAVKAAARNTSADRLFLLNPVLDIETAVSTVDRPNVIDLHRQGHRRGVTNLWGLNVNFDKFVADAVTGDYVELASSHADLAELVTPPVILLSPRKARPIEQIFGPQYHSLEAMGIASPIVSLPADASGEFGANDDRRATTFKRILELISTSLIGALPSAQAGEPSLRDVHRQRQLEQERIRIRYHVSQATRSALWGAHLAHLPQLENLPVYSALTEELYRRLFPFEPGMTVLDIGCGQRNFVRLMLTNQAYRLAHQPGRTAVPLRYIGLDQSHESLRLAEEQTHTFARELPGILAALVPIDRLVTTSWMLTDWNVPLPFSDGSIERIVFHLSLSFTPSPLHCLKEVLRVLHPDGTAVLTCFQPHTDLSTLFRRHLRAAAHDEFGSPAQTALHYLGRLHEAIRHGLLHNYERDELARLLSHAGAGSIRLFSILDNQLLLAIVRKTKYAG